MCIYLGNSEKLTYKKQEHVFPAGLGGKQMLDHGVVSDQANGLFSPMELTLMRHSLIAFERMMYGPGKRGSLNPAKASKSAVTVGLQDDGQPILCYTAAGKPYNIPQFHRHENKVTLAVPNECANAEKQIQEFLGGIINVLEENFEHSEIICVNDSSEDNSYEEIKKLSEKTRSTSISIVNMSYFHGLELAMDAGTDMAIGDFVFEFDNTYLDFESTVIMEIYHHALKGYDIVSASPKRKEKISSRLFYFVLNKSFEKERKYGNQFNYC